MEQKKTGVFARLLKQIPSIQNDCSPALQDYYHAKALEPYQAELVKLLTHIEKHQMKMIVLFEGRDAAGKGSVIGSVSRYLNPKHYRTVALGRPSEEERTQWYFQKYIKHFPKGGEIVLFDRSWYNRAMVEPIFGFCTPQEHEDFMEHVVPFEQTLVKEKTILIKLYFSVRKEVQAKRFEQRRTDPLRQWKLSEIDLQAQNLWNQFSKVKYEMLKHTSHDLAPWHVIRSNDKHLARIETMKLLLRSVDYENKNTHLDLNPKNEIYIAAEREMSLMERVKQ